MQKRLNFQRGSRKHILDWLELGSEPFRTSFNQLLAGCGAEVGKTDIWMPLDRDSPGEARLGFNGLGVLTEDNQQDLTKWWLVHRSGANTPNWDFAAGASFNGRKGLILVEAKAHVGELETAGKRPPKTNPDEEGYKRSKVNHEHIGIAIEQARNALESQVPGICISRDRYYQVSNRIAFAWKLASLSIPVVLVYLGFLNDTGMPHPFVDEERFKNVMCGYLSPVFPTAFLGKHFHCGQASMQIVLLSRTVLSPSSPPAVREQQSTYDKIKYQIVAKQK
jgi:hypothetical protein